MKSLLSIATLRKSGSKHPKSPAPPVPRSGIDILACPAKPWQSGVMGNYACEK